MKYIANIVSKQKVDANEFINIVDSLDLIYSNIPTLIIGWSFVKTLMTTVDILNKNIDQNMSWTFSKYEKREENEVDIKNFIESVFKKNSSKFTYVYFDILLSSLTQNKRFVGYITNKTKKKYIYLTNTLVYIFDQTTNTVVGVSLENLEYIGINRDKVIHKFAENNIIITDDTFLSYRCRKELGLDNTIIPYLYYLKFS